LAFAAPSLALPVAGRPSRGAAVPRCAAEAVLRDPPELLDSTLHLSPRSDSAAVNRAGRAPTCSRGCFPRNLPIARGESKGRGCRLGPPRRTRSVQARTWTVGPTRDGEAALPPLSPLPAASLRRTPLHRHARVHPLPPRTLAGPGHRSEATSLEIPFRPRGFAPPRRFPLHMSRGLVASRCRSWGSLRFQPVPVVAEAMTRGRPSPQRVSHPSKESPRQQPHRVTAAVAFLPFPRALCGAPSRPRFQVRGSSLLARLRRLQGVSPPSSL
jgi:hypothetical protein